MRLLITSTVIGKSRFLPANYQYYIGSWIYKRIAEADKDMAEFLLSYGYGEGSNKFRYFNFTPLGFRPYRLHKSRGIFELLGNNIKLEVSFFLPKSAESFLKNLFLNSEIFLGDRINGVLLGVEQVEVLVDPDFTKEMTYRLVSPCCISGLTGANEAHPQYLLPQDPEFIPHMITNLRTKYHTAHNKISSINLRDEEEASINMNVISEHPRSKFITIKALSETETKIKGWLFDFSITAPVDVQEFIWNVGLGEKGSMGFGMVQLR